MGFTQFAVGQPWPYPVPDGMQAMVDGGAEGITLALAAACNEPSPSELRALREGPLRLGVLARPALTWIMLDAGEISYDAPFCASISGQEYQSRVLQAARATAEQPAKQRRLVELYVVDRGKIAVIRIVSLSADWWRAFAAAVVAAPQLDMAAYRAAMDADQRAMTTPQMLAAASVVEVGGKV